MNPIVDSKSISELQLWGSMTELPIRRRFVSVNLHSVICSNTTEINVGKRNEVKPLKLNRGTRHCQSFMGASSAVELGTDIGSISIV